MQKDLIILLKTTVFGTINTVLTQTHNKDCYKEEKWKVYCFPVDILNTDTFLMKEKVAP